MDMSDTQMLSNDVFPDEERFPNFILQFQQMIMLYRAAIQCVVMRVDTVKNESQAKGNHVSVRSIETRIKEPQSIVKKLKRKGLPLSISSICHNLNDIAGVRIICKYISDIYRIKDILLDKNHIDLIAEKDYIKCPKPNGYRSLHLVVDVPVLLQEGLKKVRCEIQLRTTAMDSWAALEHNLRYKKDLPYNPNIDQRLKKCAAMLYESDLEMQSIACDMGIFEECSQQIR